MKKTLFTLSAVLWMFSASTDAFALSNSQAPYITSTGLHLNGFQVGDSVKVTLVTRRYGGHRQHYRDHHYQGHRHNRHYRSHRFGQHRGFRFNFYRPHYRPYNNYYQKPYRSYNNHYPRGGYSGYNNHRNHYPRHDRGHHYGHNKGHSRHSSQHNHY